VSIGAYEKSIFAEAEAIRELREAVSKKSSIKKLKTLFYDCNEVNFEELVLEIKGATFIGISRRNWGSELGLDILNHPLLLPL
jgi:hypothetical protein